MFPLNSTPCLTLYHFPHKCHATELKRMSKEKSGFHFDFFKVKWLRDWPYYNLISSHYYQNNSKAIPVNVPAAECFGNQGPATGKQFLLLCALDQKIRMLTEISTDLLTLLLNIKGFQPILVWVINIIMWKCFRQEWFIWTRITECWKGP